MRVEMTLKANAAGYQDANVFHTLKNVFQKYGLRCLAERPALIFSDAGNEDDYANMWLLLVGLLQTGWFPACAASCVFFDDDGTEEDVLAQADDIRKMLA